MARKRKMKVYHGLPKSITDEHTVFYADFDGTNNVFTNSFRYVESPSGYGVTITDTDRMNKGIPLVNTGVEKATVECWVLLINKSFDIFNFEDKSTTNDMTNRSMTVYYSDIDGLKFTYFQPETSVQPQTEIVKNSANIGWTHVRFTIDGNIASLYVNGVKHPVSITKMRPFQSLWIGSYPGYGQPQLVKIPSISDLHISDIDRGDYFPNLPQDFIEGKAVIKPRMGQQQIKGDPMYSQVTELKVDTDPNNNMYKGGVESGFQRHTYKPELSLTSSNFENGERIKIKGLNGEIISGVIDTDTALCKLIKFEKNITSTEHIIEVSDSSKLSISDTVLWVTSNLDRVATNTGTIQSIDGNVITLSFTKSVDLNVWNVGDYLFETTTSSSSPVVKTQDGTDVVGTWRGLGTNEAIFILGENTDISGKDLYITYSLNIPLGNSDFPELPHTIERAYTEEGVEMKSVNEIVIVDDFKGKISGSTKECPHRMSYGNITNPTTLLLPSQFNQVTIQLYYDRLTTLNGVSESIICNDNGGIPQQLFSFNLIEIVERKLGINIPQSNKIDWLKNNIQDIYFEAYAYGTSPNGYCIYTDAYSYVASDYYWKINGGGSIKYTNSSISKLDRATLLNSQFKECISPSGDINFILYSDASTDSIHSKIMTDYVSIIVRLKTDSTFTTLYCENTRAREDKCNPVLIQKETKTVKRYLPSKECFVTECTKLPYKDSPKCEVGTLLAVANSKILTTSGTASRVEAGNGVLSYVDKLVLPTGYYPYGYDNSPIVMYDTEIASSLSHTIQLPIIRYWGGRRYYGEGVTSADLDSCQSMTTQTDLTNIPRYEFFGAIKAVNSELKLVVRTDMRLPKNAYPPATCTKVDYTLPNRPLIK